MVTALALVSISPSAVVTRVVSAVKPLALATTPFAPFTVDSSAVISVDCVVIVLSAEVTRTSSAFNAVDAALVPISVSA